MTPDKLEILFMLLAKVVIFATIIFVIIWVKDGADE